MDNPIENHVTRTTRVELRPGPASELEGGPVLSGLAGTMPYGDGRGDDEASILLRRLFDGFEGGLAIRLWTGRTLRLGTEHSRGPEPAFTLVCRSPSVVRSMVLGRDPLRLVEAYVRGDIDVEGDFFAALALKNHVHAIRLSMRERIGALIGAFRLGGPGPARGSVKRRLAPVNGRTVGAHSKADNQAAISFHYDVSNDFYGLWLDEQCVYSCAYFTSPEQSLDQAQRNKLDHICRKLRLQRGERLLDIGCGWGALICWAAKHHGVRAHGITLSRRQFEYARQRIDTEGLQGQVSVELIDYRDLSGESVYDKVSSIGMFEHVGLRNLPTYLAAVRRILRPGGLFLNHGITHDEEGWNSTLAKTFINRYVFPDGELDCVSNIQLGMERSGFEIHDVEGLRPHYAQTLRHWVRRLEARHDEALHEVDEPTYRVWRLYMAACALEFEAGGTGVYQILASRRDRGVWPVPMTRRDLYVDDDRQLDGPR